ncbi:MAG: hypothetical protein K0R99_3304 [Microbacterium sp.]|jgi:hypothetical protein|uniref:polysaccharide pyruvyl transferase family protein n=1 Tax=Microbacterium sp. TaxID=51671 RepID=UPI00261E71DF|nr:polysaccharide pyruvyl transferase family protein [Microbacterium sp.]MDF2561858.1 hypothetical protein [Microbacterium sp.]
MKILTRTYPPTINPNYGGILQAWALQQVLAELGHTGYVDSTKSSAVSPALASVRIVLAHARDVLARLGLLPRRFQPNAVRWAANRDLFAFTESRFKLVRLYRGRGKVDRRLAASFDAFVVGSDQVWRPDFVDVASFLLDFVPTDDTRPRIAYAASFGSSSPTELFDEESRASLGPLARRFDALSTREESGVELCMTLWGATAQRLIDPTMLLSPAHYAELASGKEAQVEAGGVVTYVLDRSSEVQAVVAEIEQARDCVATELYRPLPRTYAEFAHDPGRFTRVTIEGWLNALARSGSVVTDSYHGTVFAILFNKPFLVVLNHRRGLARFETLLSLFGLEDRIAMFDGADALRASAPIDWQRVNEQISQERQHGWDFLKQSLTGHARHGSTDPVKQSS